MLKEHGKKNNVPVIIIGAGLLVLGTILKITVMPTLLFDFMQIGGIIVMCVGFGMKWSK